ncbi:MAG: hypothetical protein CMI52_03085 [Parcubacteria group bacterium]|nr:hypothetical protein [Parcubacteria group bacterium]|tara:strand:+ start:142 stop:516 length:375 start_codon:yes stop_codon:yes gene_type:complete
MKKIRSFTDLEAWKEGHQLVLRVYKITKDFPVDERYSLTSQLKRCSVSITSNIAEGFGRRTNKDKIRFFFMALGSITELQNQLLVARDVGYITPEIFSSCAQSSIQIHKMTNGLIKYAEKILYS